ncbi:MFS transporter, ACDE family, multidrug resistance protein [Thermoflavimicrobium dichotomicum]|uniref:MFS transporter, ACDE family, multidrug resistance protein n=2 Tax=Thermoflavimicrobium dichotomicum TaxID=46223 RepID=A0A1I3QBQ1_9BACL|nr:MFS transporter, ACDE family, multidrug resistance protein [Thermoflavimicrobium dichotomicum]
MTSSETHNNKPTTAALITLSFIPLIMVLGNSMIIPALPVIEKALDITSLQVSLLITLFSIPAGIVIPITGILADRVGRKKVIFFSLLLYGIGGLLAGISALVNGGSYPFLLASRILQGIGAAGTSPIAMVLISDLYQKEERSKALGINEASNAFGKVLSPIFGSLLLLISWYAMFFVFPLLCLPIAIALWKVIKEPVHKQKPLPLKQYWLDIRKIFQRKGKWLVTAFLAGSLALFTMFGVLFYLSDTLEKTYHIVGIKKGFILAIPLLALCLVAYWTGSHVKNQTSQMKKFILLGLGVMAGFIVTMPWITQMVWLIAVAFGLGIGAGLILPCLNTLITSAIGVQERGIITSLYGSVRFLGVAFGPPTFETLSNRPYLLFFGLSALFILIAVAAAIFIHQPQRLRGKDGQYRLLIRKERFQPSS